MLSTNEHLPLHLPDATQSNNLTPDEVTAWLDERERRERMIRRRHSLGVAFWIISGALLLITIALFNH